MARPFRRRRGIPPTAGGADPAFEKTMRDPEFLAEAQKLAIDVNPVSAKAIDGMLVELYATPKDVLDKAAQAMSR